MFFTAWWQFLWGKSDAEARLENEAREAENYEQWKSSQKELDELRRVSEWISEEECPWYKWQVLDDFVTGLRERRRQKRLRSLGNYLRQFKRSMANMTDPVLYRHSYIQTKSLIHQYVREVRQSIVQVMNSSPSGQPGHTLSEVDKGELIRDLRTIMGRTTLVLQGGAGASMCHIGVIKALHKQNLLPQIITGTGIGSLIAALVCTAPKEQFLELLDGEKINLSAFKRAKEKGQEETAQLRRPFIWVSSWLRRFRRFRKTGHLFDISVIEQCARDNFKDMTFYEAYLASGKVLNITTPMPIVRGTPQLLNYITAPHVVIWSAVAASVATSKTMYAPARLFIKEDSGKISNYYAADYTTRQKLHMYQASLAPLGRIGELFNVNHFIFSQTRPYIAPFVQVQQEIYRQNCFLGGIVNIVYNESLFWIRKFGILGWKPVYLKRIFMDEEVASSGRFPKLIITPKLTLSDWLGVFNTPTAERINYLADKGERSVWPFINAIKMRCAIEKDLDRAYSEVRPWP